MTQQKPKQKMNLNLTTKLLQRGLRLGLATVSAVAALAVPAALPVLAVLTPVALADSGYSSDSEPESPQPERTWLFTLKPSALYLATGGGVEIARELTDTGVLALNAELDHFLVGGTGFLGLTWRQRVFSGFYLQGGPGVTEIFFHDFYERMPGAFVVAGWETRHHGWFQPGFEFGGTHIARDRTQNIETAPAFPKLRLSIRL